MTCQEHFEASPNMQVGQFLKLEGKKWPIINKVERLKLFWQNMEKRERLKDQAY